MDLKEYRVTPDEGLFEKIEHRLWVRRMVRVGGVAAVVIAVAVATVVWLTPHASEVTEEPTLVASTEAPATVMAESTVALPTTVATHAEKQTAGNNVLPSTAKPVTRADRVSEFPQSGEAQISNKALAQPTLPPATIQPEEMPVADLILESSDDGNDADVAATKNETPDSERPHYDNILWAPNIIVPMADESDNRVFKVRSTSAVSHFQLVIYNRGGRQVFSTNDINLGWNGTRDGSPVPQGTYVWVARFRDSDGVLRQEKGSVTVIL